MIRLLKRIVKLLMWLVVFILVMFLLLIMSIQDGGDDQSTPVKQEIGLITRSDISEYYEL